MSEVPLCSGEEEVYGLRMALPRKILNINTLNLKLSGNEVYYTISLLLLIKITL
jgi:hypothetical protein